MQDRDLRSGTPLLLMMWEKALRDQLQIRPIWSGADSPDISSKHTAKTLLRNPCGQRANGTHEISWNRSMEFDVYFCSWDSPVIFRCCITFEVLTVRSGSQKNKKTIRLADWLFWVSIPLCMEDSLCQYMQQAQAADPFTISLDRHVLLLKFKDLWQKARACLS